MSRMLHVGADELIQLKKIELKIFEELFEMVLEPGGSNRIKNLIPLLKSKWYRFADNINAS